MKVDKKRDLYESIMKKVSSHVKRILESYDDDYEDDTENNDETCIYVSYIGKNCCISPCYDTDSGEDFYEVKDENGEHVCELHGDINLEDEDALEDAIIDAIDWETQDGRYKDVSPLSPAYDEEDEEWDDWYNEDNESDDDDWDDDDEL